jgi:hypothetical protein
MNAIEISKEEIARLPIRPNEVTVYPEEQLRRRLNLQKAAWLGNTHKHKVTLSFLADQSLYAVQTTVWSVTDTHVGLKGGVVLPIANIERVDLC